MVVQAERCPSRDCDQRDDCDIDKEANERNWNNQQRDQVVVAGQDHCAAVLLARERVN